jgi:hypothetical protein
MDSWEVFQFMNARLPDIKSAKTPNFSFASGRHPTNDEVANG